MQKVKRRDQAAIERLYDRYAKLVYSMALRILKDPLEAQEVVIQTFWQVWQQAAGYDSARGTVSSWLVSIARSRALDARRVRERRRETTDEPARLSQAVASGVSPDEAVWVTEQRRQVMQALARLPESQRTALELAYFEGMTHTEIAEWTGDPLGTVKTRIRLGLSNLREQLNRLKESRRPFLPRARSGAAWIADQRYELA